MISLIRNAIRLVSRPTTTRRASFTQALSTRTTLTLGNLLRRRKALENEGKLEIAEKVSELQSEGIKDQEHLNKVSATNEDNQIVFDLRSYKERGIDKIPQPKQGQKVTYLEKQGYNTQWGKQVEKVKQINKAKQARRRHINSYQKIGGGSKQPAFVVESMRADVANRYYDVAYGDGTEGSFEKENSDFYGR